VSSASFEPDFEVSVTSMADANQVIEVRGELDSGTSEELLETFRQVVAESGTGTITLDLSGVSFVDSAGTRSIILLQREARERGASVTIAAPPADVTELLRTAGVIDHFELRPSTRRGAVDASSLLERVELELPVDAQSPARARGEIRELMAGRDQIQTADVVLLASEIVTNAVVHPTSRSAGGVGLRIFTYPEGIRVEVEDGGAGFDPAKPPVPQPERGRGLFLVDRFASRWGTEHVADDRGQRFVVWFELDWRDQRSRETPTP
jgi:anti-sigma B factor antagonist